MMTTTKKVLKTVRIAAMLFFGITFMLFQSVTNNALGQIKLPQNGVIPVNNMTSMMIKADMQASSMGHNLTMDQMLDAMDLMHNMMMNMMRMMVHSNTMNGSSGLTGSNMGTMKGMS